MRYVIYGAGAIGGVIGGRLFEHGHDVVLIARGAHHDAIAANGLRLESADGVATLPIPVALHPEEAGIQAGDVVFLTMKSQDTAGGLDALARLDQPDLIVVCAQNGVNNERAALRHFSRVYGCCVLCPANHLEPGTVQATSTPISGIFDLGCYPSGVDSVAEQIATDLGGATFVSLARPDIMRWKYRKLITNLGNAVEVCCGDAEGTDPLYQRAHAEADEVLTAAGLDRASRAEDRARRGDLLQWRPIDGRDRAGNSTWQSVTRGTGAVETDYINGEIVLLGRLFGVPTPVNRALQLAANRLAHTGSAPGSIPPGALLAAPG
jgi:2-dehydropantoate 2-reductase